eukprot:TRINITY_DN17086_c0_g1_i1.p1 TRINITY_DN17086_c0_g1~~TRINITY_DN17086_c0_g1_i1.p1  ORF type:complete len:333 (-),score=50.01 TRINITY_DN17086_c0_g1_i1:9-1007(-)
MEKPQQENPAAESAQDAGRQVCSFIKRTNRNKNFRKRDRDVVEEGTEEEKTPAVVQKNKNTKRAENVLQFSSNSKRKDKIESDDAFFYPSSREIQVESDSRATATLETETEFTKDARAIRERQLKQAEAALKNSGKGNTEADKVYRGLNAYKDHLAGFRREQTISGEKAGGAHGPLRASAHIRSSVRFDYQPDICKDYKETGYCGYGDACKFMHDRGDYKAGWQLEREWEEAQKRKKENLMRGLGNDKDDGEGDDDEDEEELPFACFICRRPFEDPVVTKCRHYFCEHCALKHYARNKNCYVCNKPTNGVFNTAHEILRKMAQEKDASKREH